MLERLGKYSITEVIGRGAMGTVYKGFDPHIRRTVAIKTIRKELLENSEAAAMLARFKNEAQAAGRLSHPGIIAVYDYAEQDELAYIVMEYVQGHGLDEYFKRGSRFAARDLLSVITQLLDAIDFAHEQGVVHRDIKPSNMMVMVNGRLKVADFGIARIDTSELTQVGMIMGTPGYMAPEQYLNHDVDRRADIFAAGVIFYQLLSGVKPFVGSSDLICHKICNEDPPPPSQVDPSSGLAHFDVVVAKALAKKPEDRFQTAQAFREAIIAAHQAPVSPSISEDTIIAEAKPAVRSTEGTSASSSQPRTGSISQGTTAYPPEWDPTVLKQVEQKLTEILGPVARVMVKRAAWATTDIEKLYQLLSDDLANVQDRTTFLATRGSLSGASTKTGTSMRDAKSMLTQKGAVEAVSPEFIDQAARQLAVFVGPIAKVLAKKAAAKAKSPQEFYMLLADNLATDAEKQKFFKAVGI
ncbi:MAG TPA: serine/threonine-protein kinase [Burkholderiales bacterium]|nr:serine/threonine-protein kinase [Burkholderiales bacterium]